MHCASKPVQGGCYVMHTVDWTKITQHTHTHSQNTKHTIVLPLPLSMYTHRTPQVEIRHMISIFSFI